MNEYVVVAVRFFGIVSCIISFMIGTYVFYKNPANFLNRNFGLLASATCLWTFSEFMVRSASSAAEGMFWAKMAWGAVLVLQVITINFALRISKGWVPRGISPLIKLIAPFTLLMLGLLIWTDLIIPGVQQSFFGITRIKGKLFFLYSIYFAVLSIAALYILLRAYFKSTRIKERKQLGYSTIGLAIPFFFGGLTQVILPLFGIESLPLGSLGLVIGLWFFAVAILKYGLMTLSLSTASATILSSMSESVLLIDPEGKIRECNNALLALTGFSRGEVIKAKLSLIFKNEAVLNRILDEGTFANLDAFISGKKQEDIEVAVSSSAMGDEFGEKYGTTIVAHDVRETKALIRELEASKTVLEQKVAERTAELKQQRDTSEEKVKERTADLEAKLAELNAFHDATVGRELRMMEIEKELDALKNKR